MHLACLGMHSPPMTPFSHSAACVDSDVADPSVSNPPGESLPPNVSRSLTLAITFSVAALPPTCLSLSERDYNLFKLRKKLEIII